MVMMQPRWPLPKLKHWLLKRMSRVKITLAPRKRTPKLMQRPMEMRCEGVVFVAFEHPFCKDILAYLRHLMFVLLHLFT
jgi:hypothetical protein